MCCKGFLFYIKKKFLHNFRINNFEGIMILIAVFQD